MRRCRDRRLPRRSGFHPPDVRSLPSRHSPGGGGLHLESNWLKASAQIVNGRLERGDIVVFSKRPALWSVLGLCWDVVVPSLSEPCWLKTPTLDPGSSSDLPNHQTWKPPGCFDPPPPTHFPVVPEERQEAIPWGFEHTLKDYRDSTFGPHDVDYSPRKPHNLKKNQTESSQR